MKEVKLMAGCHIDRACAELAAAAPAFMVFNGTRVEAQPGESAADLQRKWSTDYERAAAEYRASPEYKRREAEGVARAQRDDAIQVEARAAIDRAGVRDKY